MELSRSNIGRVPAINESICEICESNTHLTKECPTIPAFKEVLHEQANFANNYKRPFSDTYNPSWQSHPNFSWKHGPTANESQGTPIPNTHEPPRRSLEDTLQAFMQGLTQINQNTMQSIQDLKNSVDRIEAQLNAREKGKFPAQPQSNPKGHHEQYEQVKSITTLRNGKTISKEIAKCKDSLNKKVGSHNDPLPNPKIVVPFSQRLLANNKETKDQEILETFKQVKINIPLLDAIKQIPSYAKFLKDLCTVKRKLNTQKKTILTEQVSAILKHNTPPKYKDPGCPTVSCNIGNFRIQQALLDLGASVNLLPYSVYEQLGLGELKPTKVTLQLADLSIKKPRGIVEDVLVQIDKFYFPVDFIVLDTQPVMNYTTQIPVILGRPFLATSNALINCRSGIMKLSFGNMTADFNIFHVPNQPEDNNENEELQEVNLINSFIGDSCTPSPSSKPLEACSNSSENEKEIKKFNTSRSPSPPAPTGKRQHHSKKLHKPHNCPFPSEIQAPNHKPQPLLAQLKNAYLGLLYFLYYSLYTSYFLYYCS